MFVALFSTACRHAAQRRELCRASEWGSAYFYRPGGSFVSHGVLLRRRPMTRTCYTLLQLVCRSKILFFCGSKPILGYSPDGWPPPNPPIHPPLSSWESRVVVIATWYSALWRQSPENSSQGAPSCFLRRCLLCTHLPLLYRKATCRVDDSSQHFDVCRPKESPASCMTLFCSVHTSRSPLVLPRHSRLAALQMASNSNSGCSQNVSRC